MWLDVLTTNCKIRFMCTLAHFGSGSLKDICKSYGISKDLCKMNEEERGFDFKDITAQNWQSYMPKIKPYLIMDVVSLWEVWTKFVDANHIVCDSLNINKCVSAPSIAWKKVLSNIGEKTELLK